MGNNRISNLIVFGTFVFLIGCASPSEEGTTSAPSSAPKLPDNASPPAITPPVATEASPLKLQINSRYNTTTTDIGHKFKETGTTTCEATTTTPNVTCTIEVPEARLYYSDLTFLFAWRNDKCKLMTFQPYFYRALNTDDSWLPAWADSPLKCTNVLTTADCYGGAAKDMVDGFPKKSALIYITDPTDSVVRNDKRTLNSSFKRNYGSNRGSSNDLPTAKRGSDYTAAQVGAGEIYKANSMVDYQLTCVDDYADSQNYTIKLFIKDVDSEVDPQLNNILTWSHL